MVSTERLRQNVEGETCERDYTQESARGNGLSRAVRMSGGSLSGEDDAEMFGGLDALGEGAPRPFAPEQMLTCEECLRANAPTRFMCLYCGPALPRTKQSAAHWRPSLKKLEEWEQRSEERRVGKESR